MKIYQRFLQWLSEHGKRRERVQKETQKPSLKPQKLNNSDPILEENDDGELETEEDREEREDEENEDNERIDEEFFF